MIENWCFSAPKSFKTGMQKKGLFCCSVFSRHSLQNGDLTNSPPLPSESKLWAASGAPGAASGGILFVSFSALEPSRWSKSSRDLKIIKKHIIFTTNLNRNLKCMQKHGSRFLMPQEPWNNQFCRILEWSFPSSSATASLFVLKPHGKCAPIGMPLGRNKSTPKGYTSLNGNHN